MKRLILKFHNTLTGRKICNYDFPLDKLKASEGWYSDFARTAKIDLANIEKVDKFFIRFVIEIKVGNWSDRMYLTSESGLKFDSPFDLTKKDIKILEHHLEGLRLAITP